jgi:hypothetical protein
MLLWLLLNVNRNEALQRQGIEIATLADSRWERLLKDVGQKLGTVKRV